ncbi:MAG TPA: DapH/DapD/GlmU-related protein [archaeon]|nr:DapH/DapD/GlmU-related protein [archaeon]
MNYKKTFPNIHQTVKIGRGVIISSLFPKEIIIKENTFLMGDVAIGGKTTIGKNCAIGTRAQFISTTHIWGEKKLRKIKTKPIVIGDWVWVGTNTVIMGGVTIGNNSIIGANAVVTHNIKPNLIVAGVPAKVIGKVK